MVEKEPDQGREQWYRNQQSVPIGSKSKYDDVEIAEEAGEEVGNLDEVVGWMKPFDIHERENLAAGKTPEWVAIEWTKTS